MEAGVGYSSDRLCLVCKQAIADLKSAASIPVGSGLSVLLHRDCATDLLQASQDRLLHKSFELLTPEERAEWVIDHLPVQKHATDVDIVKKHL